MTAFGIADASGVLFVPAGNQDGIPIYPTQFGNGFLMYAEGRPGASTLDVGSLTFNYSASDPSVRPDVEILSDRNLGNGSPAVCDNSSPDLGGVPAVPSLDFAAPNAAEATNDFSCRFSVFEESGFPCTQDRSANFAFAALDSTIQFCSLMSTALTFPTGDTKLAVRLHDTGGNPGPRSSIIVRVTSN